MLCISRFGKTSIGRLVTETTPNTTMNTISRFAATPLRANQPITPLMARSGAGADPVQRGR